MSIDRHWISVSARDRRYLPPTRPPRRGPPSCPSRDGPERPRSALIHGGRSRPAVPTRPAQVHGPRSAQSHLSSSLFTPVGGPSLKHVNWSHVQWSSCSATSPFGEGYARRGGSVQDVVSRPTFWSTLSSVLRVDPLGQVAAFWPWRAGVGRPGGGLVAFASCSPDRPVVVPVTVRARRSGAPPEPSRWTDHSISGLCTVVIDRSSRGFVRLAAIADNRSCRDMDNRAFVVVSCSAGWAEEGSPYCDRSYRFFRAARCPWP